MSESDSDTSIEPEEVEYESKPVKENVKVEKKPKNAVTFEEAIRRRKEAEADESEDATDSEPEPEPEPKKREKSIKKRQQEEGYIQDKINQKAKKYPTAGRPKLTEEQKLEKKLAKKTIIKEKVIYMIPNKDGGYKKVNNPTMSATAMRRWKREQEKEEQEEKLGKQLCAKKNGAVDNRSKPERSPAQIAACQRMLEANKKRREALNDKKKAEKELKHEKQKNAIKETIREVVHEPYKPKAEPTPPPKPPAWNELIMNKQF